jgi:streptogramin lyase
MIAAVFAQSVPAVVQRASDRHWLQLTFPGQNDAFIGIARDPSGKFVWVSDTAHGALLRIGTNKRATRFTLMTAAGPFTPGFFTFARDGAIYTGGCLPSGCDVIGRLSPDLRAFTTYSTPPGDGPGMMNQLATAPDGLVWFVSKTHFGSVDRNGAIREYAGGLSPSGPNIVVDHRGGVWYDGMSTSSYPTAAAGYFDPSTRKANLMTLGSPYLFSGPVQGMAVDGDGRVDVLVTDEGDYFIDWVIDAIDAKFNQTTIGLGQSNANGSAALIAGAGHELWWGTNRCPWGSTSSEVPCTLGRYDTATHKLFAVDFGKAGYLGASNLASGDDGTVWALCCSEDASPTPGSVLIYTSR